MDIDRILENLYEKNRLSDDEIDFLIAEIARLRAEVAALRVDAERYRWIRDGGWMLIGADRGNGPEWPDAIDVDHRVDAAIDAAMGQK